MKNKVAYYVSAHGYGHGVRTCDILSGLSAFLPEGCWVELTTGLPEGFLRPRLGSLPITLREGSFDAGMVQLDSVAVDVPATLRALEALFARRAELVQQEISYLRDSRASLVVADIPSLPMEAAYAAGVPCAAIGNFGWNWIYAPFAEQDARWRPLIEQIEEGYRRADLLLKLPFSEEMSVFKRQVDIPLLARPGTRRREELAMATGADTGRQWVLLSFSALNWCPETVQRVSGEKDYEFFTVKPLEWAGSGLHAVDRRQFSFSDVLATVDSVLSKPGYGLLSECIVNRKPLAYVDRRDFIEYPILEKAIQRYVRGVHIPQEDLYAGRLRPYLEALADCPEPEEAPANDGVARVAEHLAALLNR